MSDRAVVDGEWEPGTCLACGAPDNPPRALVALSEDRRWLVVLEPEYAVQTPPYLVMWWVYKRNWNGEYVTQKYVHDTGQDAHAVLREWLEGQHA